MKFEDALKKAREGAKPKSSSFSAGEYIYFKPATSSNNTGYLGQQCDCNPVTTMATGVCNSSGGSTFNSSSTDWYLYKHDNNRGEIPYYPDQYDMVKADWTV